MRDHDNGTAPNAVTLSSLEGAWFASLGVLCFSFSLPATRLAMRSFGPVTVSLGRAVIASVFAGIWLIRSGARRPTPREAALLLCVASGVVVGFPVLSSLALRQLSATHSSAIFSVTPALTAVLGALLARERPSLRFWIASVTATVTVVSAALLRSHGGPTLADALLLVAVVFVSVGYAVGATLARTLSGPAVISWALVLSLPVTLPIALGALVLEPRSTITASAVFGLGYVSIVSMLLGFFAWYRGLASFGVAKASQLQLAQGPLCALWSYLLLGESLSRANLAVFAVVIPCAWIAARSRVRVLSPRAQGGARTEAYPSDRGSRVSRAIAKISCARRNESGPSTSPLAPNAARPPKAASRSTNAGS